MQGWLAAITSVGVLVWVGILGIAFSAKPRPSDTGAARFVAADGGLERVALGADQEPAAVDSARVRGAAALAAAPRGAVRAATPPDGMNPRTSEFWRESVRPAHAPGDPTAEVPGGEFRLHGLAPDGLYLLLALGPTEGGGVAIQKGLLELPNDVAPGRSWTSRATARAGARTVSLANTSRAEEAADPAHRKDGCLDVHGETTVDGRARTEVATWCPGRGVVGGTPMLGASRAAWDGAWPPPPIGDAARRVIPDQLRVERPVAVSGDPLMGWQTNGADAPVATEGVALADGTVVQADAVTGALVGWRPVPGPEGRAELQTRWWVQPGGAISHLDAIGDTVMATTSNKRVAAYDASGRRLWSRTLRDLAPSGVTGLGHDGVVIATMSGEVAAYSLVDGAKRWATRVPGGGAGAPVVAGDRVLVMTGSDGLVALDVESGTKVFDQADASGAIATSPDGSIVTMHTGGELLRFDAASGDLRQTGLAGVGTSVATLTTGHGYLVALGDRALTFVDPGQLREVRRIPGVLDVVEADNGWLAVTATEALALAPNGDERGRVPLGVTLDEARLQWTAEGATVLGSEPRSQRGLVLWLR